VSPAEHSSAASESLYHGTERISSFFNLLVFPYCAACRWHRAPPQIMLASADDPSARFMYRASVKGPPSLSLPRPDTEEWLQDHIAGAYRTPADEVVSPSGPPVRWL
jgi:hypothetical protein